MRILNIVENLDKGAVENWLVNVFLTSRQMRPDWDWTFYCILGRPGRLDEKVKAAGGKIIYAPFAISEKRKFLEHLRKELKAGRYDIIHSHHDYLSGFYLLSSRGIQFRKRILHVHNTDKALPVGSRFMEKLLLKPFRWLGYRYSDVIVGISEDTLMAPAIGRARLPASLASRLGRSLALPIRCIAEPRSCLFRLNIRSILDESHRGAIRRPAPLFASESPDAELFWCPAGLL